MTSLARLLRERGLTHVQLAQMSGVNRTTITRMANGERFERMGNIVALAWALDVPVTELQDLTDRKELPSGPIGSGKAELYVAREVIREARSLLEIFRAPRPEGGHYSRELKEESNRRLVALQERLRQFDLKWGPGEERDLPDLPRLFT